ncbi:MAG: LacI family transcriptional regulator [Paracoccaceae bacterium]
MTDSPRTPGKVAPLPAGERPTLKTISRLTGLAVATVSRALHDAPDIGSDTKRRVQETADRIGYRPNRAGVRLRTGKTNVISLVLSTDHDMMNHTARLISSLAGELRGTPYHMIVTPYFPSEDPMLPVRYIVESGSADAVILNQTEPEDPRVAYLMRRNFPFATHGRTKWCADHAYYDFDNTRFAEVGIEELARRGRQSVLMVAPPARQNYGRNMIEGAQRRAHDLGIACTVLPEANSDSASAEIEAAFADYFAEHPETDAVLCGSTTATMAVVARAEDMGQTIGEDLDVFAKEAIPFLQRFRRAILTVHEDVATAGGFLARAAIRRIEDPAKPPMQGLESPKFEL